MFLPIAASTLLVIFSTTILCWTERDTTLWRTRIQYSLIKFKQMKPIKIRPKALIKATSFMFLPTLSVMIVIFCYFLSWSKFVGFMTSDNGWASFLRVLMILAELVLVCIMYEAYAKIEEAEERKKELTEAKADVDKPLVSVKRSTSLDTSFRYLGKTGYQDVEIYRTKNPDIFVLSLTDEKSK